MFLILAVVFAVLWVSWVLGWVAFHAPGGFIHLLLIAVFNSIVVHLVRVQGPTPTRFGWGCRDSGQGDYP